MKTYLPYSLILAAAATGMAFGAETAYTTPVGYETQALPVGTSYVGVRLHNPTILAGTLDTISATQMTDAAVNFGTAMTGATTTYIVEFENASGVIQEVLGSAASGSTLNLPDNVTAFVTVGTQYSIRAASTIASVFGATNSAGLAAGFGGPGGADLVQTSNGAGGLNQFYYDGDESSWFQVGNPVAVNPSLVPIVYTDAFLVVIDSVAKSLVVSGEIKTGATNHALVAATNYVGSVYPVGATLTSAFGSPASLAALDQGFGGPGGADLFQILDGSGFNQYFYDGDESSWFRVSPAGAVDGSTIVLPSGFILANENSAFNLLQTAPASYSSL